jgi:hypothetical protein
MCGCLLLLFLVAFLVEGRQPLQRQRNGSGFPLQRQHGCLVIGGDVIFDCAHLVIGLLIGSDVIFDCAHLVIGRV